MTTEAMKHIVLTGPAILVKSSRTNNQFKHFINFVKKMKIEAERNIALKLKRMKALNFEMLLTGETNLNSLTRLTLSKGG